MAFVPIYILILAFTIFVDYYAAIFIQRAHGKRRKTYLVCSLIANIGVLCIFKYYNFINSNFSFLLHGFGLSNPLPYLSILLPIGLSFHTFQAMSYTIEVYRSNQQAEKHFGIYSLYVMFYPQLVAGPIERPQNLLQQFREKHDLDYERVVDGLKLILWGFFKKLVIADRLALYVNAVYNNSEHHNGMSLLVATIFFAFQIYCDFSGYSDIAIGAARVMGFKLMTNFNRPYFSKSIAEFWKRWHISLSTWFKDYLYIPLGGNRVSVPRWVFNLFIVFLISGLWHGANWTYIIWGAINGLYLVMAIITQKWRNKFSHLTKLNKLPLINNFFQVIITFCLICFAWIFFRANSLPQALAIIEKIASFNGSIYNLNSSVFFFSVSAIAFLLIVEFKREYFNNMFRLSYANHWLIRNLYYAFLITTIILAGVFDGGEFIYFQF
jgi:D-alanyl-lipoteichoic acid acyltransferase DltB (MBOAT superfamily)